MAVQLAALAAGAGRAQLLERGAGGHELRGAGLLEPGARRRRGRHAALGREGGESAHVGIAREGEQVPALVDEPEEDGVEGRPARGIGRAGRLPSEIEELAGHPSAPGGRRSRGERRSDRLAPVDLARRHALVQERAGRRLPASNVGWISTVLMPSACHGWPPAARPADQPPFGPLPAAGRGGGTRRPG